MNVVKPVHRQNLQDITLQTKGDMEQLFAVAMANGKAITGFIVPGVRLLIPIENGNKDILDYYRVKKVVPATATKQKTQTCTYAICGYVAENYWI